MEILENKGNLDRMLFEAPNNIHENLYILRVSFEKIFV